jgi:hypothetical protein
MLLKGADGGIMDGKFSELLEFCRSEVNTVKVGQLGEVYEVEGKVWRLQSEIIERDYLPSVRAYRMASSLPQHYRARLVVRPLLRKPIGCS